MRTFFNKDITQGFVSNSGMFYQLWINNSTLALVFGTWAKVLSEAQFFRLASISPANSSLVHVYCQLDQFTVGAETYDTSIGHWEPANFSIDTS